MQKDSRSFAKSQMYTLVSTLPACLYVVLLNSVPYKCARTPSIRKLVQARVYSSNLLHHGNLRARAARCNSRGANMTRCLESLFTNFAVREANRLESRSQQNAQLRQTRRCVTFRSIYYIDLSNCLQMLAGTNESSLACG